MRKNIISIMLSITMSCIHCTPQKPIVAIPQRPPKKMAANTMLSRLHEKLHPASIEKEIFRWFRTFSEVIHLVTKRHYKEIDIPAFIQYALKAALPKTDPHSSFFSQKSYKAAIESTSGKFSGIGISIMNKNPEDDSLYILDVIQGGPSSRAGMRAGDQIIAIDDVPLKGLSADEVISKLRGKVGTRVNLKILRKKKFKDITITREIIKDQNLLAYKFKDHDIYYVSLRLFADNTPKQMASILKRINKDQSKGLIIDLRKNPGGVLDSAVDMVSLFVKKGSLVASTKNHIKATINTYYTKHDPVLKRKVPIFLLIDNFSASASEIFAGCLKHYSSKDDSLLTFLVGTPTFGKGSVQEVIPISNGCALKLTTMTYILPDDTPIQAEGIIPDRIAKIKIKPPKKTQWYKDMYGKELLLKNHIPSKKEQERKEKFLKKVQKDSKEETAKNWEERYRKAVTRDTQVQTCVNMINMMHMAAKLSPVTVSTRASALGFLKSNFLADEKIELEKLS